MMKTVSSILAFRLQHNFSSSCIQSVGLAFGSSVAEEQQSKNRGHMNSASIEPEGTREEEMLREYDFTGGTRGKHYQAYRNGHSVTVHQADGSAVVQHFQLAEGAVMLDPEVRQYFPDSDAVNFALRMLISLIPKEHAATTTEEA